jgi:hypothetical protein
MKCLRLKKYACVRKILHLFVIGAFFLNFTIPEAWPIVEEPELRYEIDAQPQETFLKLDVDTFTIPDHLGEVKLRHRGDPGRIVLHVQDAHCNYFAQHKIYDILDYFCMEYGIDLVNLEGGIGEYNLDIFTSILNPEVRKKVSDRFVNTGEVNGAEFFAINNTDKVKLWGIEDKNLYLENLKVYRDSLIHKKEVEKYLKELTHILNNLKRHIYSSELLKIDIVYNSYQQGKT